MSETNSGQNALRLIEEAEDDIMAADAEEASCTGRKPDFERIAELKRSAFSKLLSAAKVIAEELSRTQTAVQVASPTEKLQQHFMDVLDQPYEKEPVDPLPDSFEQMQESKGWG